MASMWHILVRLVDGCQVIGGSCAIYVGIRSLISANEWELKGENWVQTSAEDCKT